MTIKEIIKKYSNKLDLLDLDLILAHSLGKTREFILIHAENSITSNQSAAIDKLVKRRIKGEPIAYLTGHKEFYGLDFIINKHTLVPRPETEMLVELALNESKVKSQKSKVKIVDIGTGSGNIIISIAKTLLQDTKYKLPNIKYIAIDISKEALKTAKSNAKLHGVEKKIKLLHGNLLAPLFDASCFMFHALCPMIIVANLPYLSAEIYQSAPIDVKKYEPKSALYSAEAGLAHYCELLTQLKTSHQSFSMFHVSCFLEISPEQKIPLTKMIKNIFPAAEISFEKDLAKKWRVCKIEIC
ncbi:MAG: peptide chain release factor N(5)-glutamine methyltransferase [Candidatus Moraniibacteriota bacterium]